MLHRCRRGFELSGCIVKILLGQRVLLGKRFGPGQIRTGGFKGGFLHGKGGFCLIELGLKGFGIHQKEHLPLFHDLALGVHPFIEKAADPRLNVDQMGALRLSDVLESDRHILWDHFHHRDNRRLRRRNGLFFFAT